MNCTRRGAINPRDRCARDYLTPAGGRGRGQGSARWQLRADDHPQAGRSAPRAPVSLCRHVRDKDDPLDEIVAGQLPVDKWHPSMADPHARVAAPLIRRPAVRLAPLRCHRVGAGQIVAFWRVSKASKVGLSDIWLLKRMASARWPVARWRTAGSQRRHLPGRSG